MFLSKSCHSGSSVQNNVGALPVPDRLTFFAACSKWNASARQFVGPGVPAAREVSQAARRRREHAPEWHTGASNRNRCGQPPIGRLPASPISRFARDSYEFFEQPRLPLPSPPLKRVQQAHFATSITTPSGNDLQKERDCLPNVSRVQSVSQTLT
jgi:hypothetical protein